MVTRLQFTVTEQDTARALGSGALDVLGTPRLLAWCEAATCAAAQEHLDPGASSVGTRVQLDHLAASAVGARVRVRADLVHRDGRLLEFDVVAHDDAGEPDTGTDAATDGDPDGDPDGGRLVATGRIRRVAVDAERFMARLAGPAGPRRDGRSG